MFINFLYSLLLNGLGTSCRWKIDVRRVISFQCLWKSESLANLCTGKAFPRNSNAREDFFPDHRLVPFFKEFPASSVFCIAYGYVIPKWRPCRMLECWILAIKLPVIPTAGKMQTLRCKSLIKVDDCKICFLLCSLIFFLTLKTKSPVF